MEIQYLKDLKENPKAYPNDTEDQDEIESIPMSEIETLETTYNNGNPFPKALRELLYLAGGDCYVLDYGAYDSQNDLQESQREAISDYRQSITRPFYAIDCYNDYETLLFVYLDEGDNPPVYEFTMKNGEIRLIKSSLKLFIEARINRVKDGINPF